MSCLAESASLMIEITFYISHITYLTMETNLVGSIQYISRYLMDPVVCNVLRKDGR